MTDLVADLAAQGLTLTPEERLRLVDLLLGSLDDSASDEIKRAWDVEIARRVAAHERGEGRLYEVEEVMADAARIAP